MLFPVPTLPAELILWIAFATLAYMYIGYPLLLRILTAGTSRREIAQAPAGLPEVTVVLVAFNEAGRMEARLANLLQSDYPAEKLSIVVVSDGSTDDTVARANGMGDSRIQCLSLPQRGGKARALNAGVAAAKGAIVVFADARQTFAPDAIRRLAAAFARPQTGAVSGELRIAAAASAVGSGVDAYWKYEKFIRRSEAQLDSAIGCTGAIYAIQRELYRPIPEDTILDDVVVPMLIAQAGHRVGFDPEAVAWDPQALEPERERIRKQRTLAGNFQMLLAQSDWLLPWKHRLWWQLISHKYLRLAAPVLLLLVAMANLALAHLLFYRLLLVLQGVFYLCALAGMFLPKLNLKVFSVPAGFVFLNSMVVSAFYHHLRGTYRGGAWQMAPASKPA